MRQTCGAMLFSILALLPVACGGVTVSVDDSSREKTTSSAKTKNNVAQKTDSARETKNPKTATADSTHKLALLVGCTKYDSAPSLTGPINDVALMSARFQFKKENVHKLVGWPDDEKQRPIYANIVAGFQQLIAESKPGSQVVILLSGHGSQVPVSTTQKSLLDPANREPDGMDEVFLPSDFKNWKQGTVRNSLSDNQLSGWLKKLKDKGAFVWLICDCCHSGTLSKSGAGPASDVRWRRADPAKHLGIPAAVMRAAVKRIGESGASKGVSLEATPVDIPTSNDAATGRVVAFYAAQPFEEAPEMPRPRNAKNKTDSAVHGMLTYSLAQVLEQNRFPMTYRELSQKVLAAYRAENLSFLPTPSCDGDVEHEVLGLQSWPGRSDFLLERHDGKPFVTGGELHGLTVGTILRVRPPAGSTDATKTLGFLKVSASRVTLSEIVPCEYDEKGKTLPAVKMKTLPELSRCDVVYRAAATMPLKLALKPLATSGPSLTDILKALPQSARGFVQPCEAKDAAWILRAGSDKYDLVRVIGSTADNPTVQSYKTKDVKKLAEWLGDDLRKIAVWQNIWKVADASFHSRSDEKKPRFRFEVRRVPADKATPSVEQSTVVVYPQDVLELTLDNRRGFENVWVTVLFLDANYGIDVFFSESIGEGKSLKPIEIDITDESYGAEGLVVLVQNLGEFGQRQRFEFLSQKQLGQRTRGETKGAPNPRTPFEKLLATVRGEKGQNTKGFPLGHPANPVVFTHSWITRRRAK